MAPPAAEERAASGALLALGAMLFIFSNWRAWILSQLGFAPFFNAVLMVLNAVLMALFLGVAAFFAFAPARAMQLVPAVFACAGSGAATVLVPREERGVVAATRGGADSLKSSKSALEEDLRCLRADSCPWTDREGPWTDRAGACPSGACAALPVLPRDPAADARLALARASALQGSGAVAAT